MKLYLFSLVWVTVVYAEPQVRIRTHSDLKIIGGRDAIKGEVPWIGSLQECFLSFICYHICGAAILSSRWVATAAHCLGGDPMFTYRIVTGAVNLNENDPDKQFQDINLRVIHPLYNTSIEDVQSNDIALLRLSRPLGFTQAVRSVQLPPRNTIPSIGSGKIAGWGSIVKDTDNPILPIVLQVVNLPLITIEQCSASINALIPNNTLPLDISGGNFCAGPLTGGRSPCVGDNGGPLVINNTLIGIASWGFSPCGYMGAPSIYTNIGNYVSWISLYVTDS